MLCALTVTACNDDDCINGGTDNNNLQVEVSTSLHSRASIHSTALPDNNPIGVTLTATDGSSYDKQNYTNIPYYGITADGKQTWQPQDKPVTLSVTEGVAMAYWPYNQNAADMTAVPVETDSQTDYMYSGNVTGLSNTAPKAAFQMKHAMALVRVNVVRGTYTAAGTVTAVTVSSEAFCTSGTMNVSTGALADLAGAETPFIEEPSDAVITTSGRMTEFLVLPDVDVDAATVTLGVTVDGRKYSTAVEVTEVFKQGYIYTFNLTLDNTALNVSAVAVAPWKEEISVEAPKPVAEDDQYIVEVTIDSDNYTYKHNISGFIGTIDWGDGIIQTIETKTNYPSHDYATAGKYLVIATGTTTELRSYNINTRDISKIIKIGGDLGVVNMSSAFQDQKKLTEIPLGVFDELTEVTNFGAKGGLGCFLNCIGLTGPIPEGLFDKCVKVKAFSYTFKGCSGLTGAIPAGLFDKCPEVTDFSETFAGCSNLTGNIPAGLFDNNTKVTSFQQTFMNCSKITGAIPAGLFDNCPEVTTFYKTFHWCSGINEIPVGLFKNNAKNTNIVGTFQGLSIISIPAGLFDSFTEITSTADGASNFVGTFMGCAKLTSIPEGLFDKCTKMTNFGNCFADCKGLTAIPEGLFDKCPEVTDFHWVFYGCSNLKTIPIGLFDYNIKVTNFRRTFMGCAGITEIPQGLFKNNTKVEYFNDTFKGCKSITTIPAGLFDNCTEVIQFGWNDESGCFASSGVTEIPEGLFKYNTKVTSFAHVFDWCTSLTGEIPEGLFDNCPDVTTFQRCFYLTRIPSIPISIFDKNTKVTNFHATFGNIGTLANGNESPYTIINVDGEDKKVHLYERSLYPEHFTAPTGYSVCYGYGSYTHFSDKEAIIAAGWN